MPNALGLVLGLMFLLWASAQPVSQNALPAAESILHRYIEVAGGAAAHKSRTSETLTGTFELAAAGITGQLPVILKPGLQRARIEFPVSAASNRVSRTAWPGQRTPWPDRASSRVRS
jgi:hypothetical protein